MFLKLLKLVYNLTVGLQILLLVHLEFLLVRLYFESG